MSRSAVANRRESARERDLTLAALSDLRDVLAPRSASEAFFLTEMSIGTVRPDIVVGLWRMRPLIRSAPISVPEAALLGHILVSESSGAPLHANRHYAAGAQQMRYVKSLCRKGFLDSTTSGLGSTRLARTLVPRIISIEAKLRRVEDALAQAMTYRAFSHESYILIPASSLSRDLLEAATELGVGVLTRSERGLRRVRRAAVASPRADLAVHIAGRLLNRGHYL